MNLYPPGPSTRVFGGVPTGVANAQDAATAIAIRTAFGSAPRFWEIAKPIGHSSAEDAVLDMNWVRPQDRMNRIAVTTNGEGEPPIRPTVHSAHN